MVRARRHNLPQTSPRGGGWLSRSRPAAGEREVDAARGVEEGRDGLDLLRRAGADDLLDGVRQGAQLVPQGAAVAVPDLFPGRAELVPVLLDVGGRRYVERGATEHQPATTSFT
ncbi:hypothetical protein ACFQBY_00150 [Promicromonospora citrea]|uniref:hypothetical protein n=1 Tax=Promicromonospora citrea TaxID=43677 RepID=UPI00360F3767